MFTFLQKSSKKVVDKKLGIPLVDILPSNNKFTINKSRQEIPVDFFFISAFASFHNVDEMNFTFTMGLKIIRNASEKVFLFQTIYFYKFFHLNLSKDFILLFGAL